mmetsp:Transcript_11314/g.22859  ORF Transcript_11314/g.22859 Transcript_11314/m.22859 type:complete len:130 (-) Transcript_11314:3885-4274(-)
MKKKANISEEAMLASGARDLPNGVYLGWATLDLAPGHVYKMVANIGIVPTFGDVPRRLLEAHLMHPFQEMFYGAHMRLRLIGFLRPEMKFSSFPELVKNIHNDVQVADVVLRRLDPPGENSFASISVSS